MSKAQGGNEMGNEWQTTEVDQAIVETFGPQYPFVYWVNGRSQMKQLGGVPYTGGWFMPVDQLDTGKLNEENLPGSGWEHGSIEFENGGSQAGFYTKNIHIAMLVWRRRWIVNGVDGGFSWNDYKGASATGNPRGHMQMLGLIRGMEQFGPTFLSMKGMVSKAIVDTGPSGVFGAFNQYIIAEAANHRNGKRPPFMMFWMSIGPRMKGNIPEFTVVGQGSHSSTITLPCLIGVTEKLNAEGLGKRFVGAELFAELTRLRKDPDILTWEKAWSNTSLDNAEGASTNGLPDPEEPPFEYEDEIPF